MQISLNFKTFKTTKIRGQGVKLCGFSNILNLKGMMMFLSQRDHAFC